MDNRCAFHSAASGQPPIGDIVPWSAYRPSGPIDLPEEIACRNARELNPLASARVYEQFYDQRAGSVSVHDPVSGQDTNYVLHRNINDPESGFQAKVIINPENNHAILMFKGMDLPGRDEGAGRLGFDRDIGDRMNAEAGNISGQVLAAENAYLEILADPNVSSLEIVGYSIGSIPANYLSAVYGAQSTNVANLGVPNANSFNNGFGLFNPNIEDDFPTMEGGFLQNIEASVTSLVISYDDAMGGVIGDVGSEYGTDIQLDRWYNFNVQGLGHVPGVYASIAEQHPETPTVTLLQETDGPLFETYQNPAVSAAHSMTLGGN